MTLYGNKLFTRQASRKDKETEALRNYTLMLFISIAWGRITQ